MIALKIPAAQKPVLEYDSRTNPYFPHQVLMESTSACQLRCLMCAREDALEKGTLKVGQMQDELAHKIINEVAEVNPEHTRLWFCFFGEPTLSKKVWGRIKMAKSKGIRHTVINSNGNNLTPSVADQLIDSGLDEVFIGLDAATPETYAQVRRRGDYNKVIDNINYLLKNKKPNLQLTVQFGVYAENEHEVEAFIKYWTDREVPVFVRPKMTWIGTLPEHYSTSDPRYPCSWQMDSLPIYFDGRVPFCICDWDNRLPQGDINKQSITEVWQTNYRRWQNLNLSGKFNELPDFCRDCRDWQTKSLKGAAKEMFEKKQCFDDVEMVKPGYLKTKDIF